MDPAGARRLVRPAGDSTRFEEGGFLESCVPRDGSLGGGGEGLRKPSAWGSLTLNIEPLLNALDWPKDPGKGRPVTFPKAAPGGGLSVHPTPAFKGMSREGGKASPHQCSLGWGGFE